MVGMNSFRLRAAVYWENRLVFVDRLRVSPSSGMGTVKKVVVSCIAASAASSALAFESRTLTFDVPNTGSPTFPPDPAIYATAPRLGSWDTVDFNSNLGLAATPGLQVPRLNNVFTLFSVPAELQGALASVDITVNGFVWLSYKVDNDNPGAIVNGSVVLDAQLNLYPPMDTAPLVSADVFPAPGFFDSPPATDLVVVLDKAVPGINLDPNIGDPFPPPPSFDEQPGDGDYVEGETTQNGSASKTYTSASGASFTAFEGSGTAYIPVSFTASSLATGGGNIGFQGDTFGAAQITITYTFVPESDLAWAGLPLVVGGWLIRRRMVAGKKA